MLSRKARQLILMPKSPSICIYVCLYVYMSITVSYGHLACGLEIISVAIPMASSCFIYLYNVLNSQFRLLLISSLYLWWSVRWTIEAGSAPFSAPGPHHDPSGPQECWAKWRQLPKEDSWCAGIKGIGVWKNLWLSNSESWLYTSSIYSSRYICSSMVCLR